MEFGYPPLDNQAITSIIDTFGLETADLQRVRDAFYHELFPAYRRALLESRKHPLSNDEDARSRAEMLERLRMEIMVETSASPDEFLIAASYPDARQWKRRGSNEAEL